MCFFQAQGDRIKRSRPHFEAKALDDLLDVRLELRLGGLLQGHGQGRDALIVRPALQTREDRRIDLLLQVVHDGIALPHTPKINEFARILLQCQTFVVQVSCFSPTCVEN